MRLMAIHEELPRFQLPFQCVKLDDRLSQNSSAMPEVSNTTMSNTYFRHMSPILPVLDMAGSQDTARVYSRFSEANSCLIEIGHEYGVVGPLLQRPGGLLRVLCAGFQRGKM